MSDEEPTEFQSHAGAIEVAEGGEPIEADENLLEDEPSDTEEIDLTHLKIKSLKKLGLARFPKVKSACFRQNLLTSLSGLDDLPKDLESLDLYDNRIQRMDHHLEHFNDGPLNSLDLSFNTIRHIRHVERLTNLKDLYLCQNEITRIDNLDTLTKLDNLELGANKIRELANLEKLQSLTTLWVARNKITKIENLSALTNLRLLSIQSNRITKIEGLEKLVNLEELYISHNGIEKIEGLENCPKLTTLDISNNRITKLEGLGHLTNLEELWASNNQIDRLDSVEKELKHLSNLKTVYFEMNPIQKSSGVMYRKKVQLALGPSLEQIDATPIAPARI